MSRCWAALFPRANFLDVLEGNPDLYGPFWIATTVILILFLGGTISQWLVANAGTPFMYDFKLLSGTVEPCHPSQSANRQSTNFFSPRRRRPHLRIYPRHPHCPLSRPPLLWQRIRQPPRVLGALRLLQPHLDPRRLHQLVAAVAAQLDLCCCRLRRVCFLFAAQPVSCPERH